MGKQAEFGTIEVGKRADLILLDKNPLTDVNHLQERSGVMLRGRWFSEEQLQTMLDSLAESYQPQPLERIWPLILIAFAIYLMWRSYRNARRAVA
jgi:hypothetical protein